MDVKQREKDIKKIDDQLWARFESAVVGGDDLRKLLGFGSPAAFKQAINRGHCPIPVFSIEHRRGKFALVSDVASWLFACRQSGIEDMNNRRKIKISGV